MNLIKFDQSNTISTRIGQPTIRFYKSGNISISKTACERIGLKKMDKISIVQDEENPEDWYLLLHDENGFPLRDNQNTYGLMIQNAFIARTIIEFMEVETNSICFRLATKKTENEDGLQLYAILMSSAQYNEIEK